MSYYPTDFATAKELARKYQQHRDIQKTLEQGNPSLAIHSQNIADDIEKLLIRHGFNTSGEPDLSLNRR